MIFSNHFAATLLQFDPQLWALSLAAVI